MLTRSAVLAVATAALASPSIPASPRPAPLGYKADLDALLSGDQDAPALPGPEGNPFTAAEEKYQYRAWPAAEIPFDASHLGAGTFASIAATHDADEALPFAWRSLGPIEALYPAILGRTGASYVASGRITALAIDPSCDRRRCRLWVGAAGGGIWRTNRALASEPDALDWKFISGGLDSNAIGSIVVDPNDPTGDTVYVGTGEPNASVDSEAGTGIYRSTDGGDTWARLPAVATVGTATFPNFPRDRAVSAMAIDTRDPRTIYVASARAIRGMSASDGGAVSNPPPAANPSPLGLYKSSDGGATFTRIWNGAGSVRGVNQVTLDPRDPAVIYASAFQKGLWRSSPSESGGAFLQVFATTNPALNFSRTQFALTAKDGHTRIYLGDGAQGPPPAGQAESTVWRADTAEVPAAVLLASQTAPVLGLWKELTRKNVGDPGFATYNYCTGQCWYDNDIATPPGEPDTVFVLGSYTYSEAGTFTNARAVLRSTTAGEPDPAHGDRTFTDMTNDATSASAPNSIHPDQHAIVFAPGNPGIWFEGSDGGLVRSSGRTADISSQCSSRTQNGGEPLTADQLAACRRLLSAVPTRFVNMNFGLDTIQFQMLSVHPARPRQSLQGGTQDNGTFVFSGSPVTWLQTGGGDGGFSGYNVARPDVRFRTNFGQFVHGTRQGADPAGWYHIGGPILFSPEASLFYMPVIYDPHPARADTIFAGSQGVWRTQDNGGDPAFLEAHCQSISTPDRPTCGDFVELGGAFDPTLGESPGDLTSKLRGSRPFGFISVLARAPSDTSTLWVATSTGRVFVSTNADGPAAAVTYARIDTLAPNTPPRYPSGIVVDRQNPFHAWISYSGYSGTIAPPTAEPNKPGHVFEVDYDGTAATWLPLDEPMGDLPVDSIARDGVTGDLYVSTDFGVLRQPAGTIHWHAAGTGLPAVEVPHLSLSERGRVLYAATHGRGAFVLRLPGFEDGP